LSEGVICLPGISPFGVSRFTANIRASKYGIHLVDKGLILSLLISSVSVPFPGPLYITLPSSRENIPLTGCSLFTSSLVHLVVHQVADRSSKNLWHHLRRLGLYENEESHPILGNVKLALEGLVQQ
ncbi:Hypothetical predicted protein, partial [Olea europaea subsp. europaea]